MMRSTRRAKYTPGEYIRSGTGCEARPGSGMLGRTLACGSARLTADLIERKASFGETAAFALRRAA